MTSTPDNDPFASPTPGSSPQGYPPPGGAPQGHPPPSGYGGGPVEGLPGWGEAPRSDKTNTLAIAAFVMAFVFSLAGLVLGIIARGQIKKSGEKGGGLALAAIIISSVSIGLVLLVVIGGGLFAASEGVAVQGLLPLR